MQDASAREPRAHSAVALLSTEAHLLDIHAGWRRGGSGVVGYDLVEP